MPLAAFPGAEGFGSETIHGRGGTPLFIDRFDGTNTGPGSAVYAFDQAYPRIIIPRVSGWIDIEEPLTITEDNWLYAGQASPGGLGFMGEEFRIQSSEFAARHLRVATGDVRIPRDGWQNRDVVTFNDAHNGVLEQCSLRHGVDENVSFWDATTDVTLMRSWVTEALHHSFHPDSQVDPFPGHSMGILVGDGSTRIALLEVMVVSCNQRNPEVNGGRVVLRNFCCVNRGEAGAEFEGGGNQIDFINANFRDGIDTLPFAGGACIRVGGAGIGNMTLFIPTGSVDGFSQDPTRDPWLKVRTFGGNTVPEGTNRVFTAHEPTMSTALSAARALCACLERGGATKPVRDASDLRLEQQIRAGTCRIIDSVADVGGWPTLSGGAAPVDSDNDGIPDYWEIAHGLDPNDPTDANETTPSGYTWLEVYLNELAG